MHGLRQHHEQDFQRQKGSEAGLLSPMQALCRQRRGEAVHPPFHPAGLANRFGAGEAEALRPDLLHAGRTGHSATAGYPEGRSAAGTKGIELPAGKAEPCTEEPVS